jgi:transglutaminase-like putative cysteine protease
MTTGNCLAAYSAGMSMGQPDLAWWFVYAIVSGNLFSLLIRRLFGQTSFVQIDSFLYAAATSAAVLETKNLNAFLPGDGIPADVITAGWLCWMLTFGSALTWRDRTLLFQAVPTIALFGLVGCYDTYSPAPFMFFGFLLCLATLLGRSHSREMLRQAVESGYFNRADAPNTPSQYPEQSPELYEDIKKGPWRWLAGPEWALLSGLAIVLISLLGAPAIRTAVQPLAGVIHVNQPHNRYRNVNQPTPPVSIQSYEVGKGPIFDPTRKPVPLYAAQLDRIRYLRTATFDEYTGHGWRSSYVPDTRETPDGPNQVAIREIPPDKQHAYHITIQPETGSPVLPLPAETLNVAGPVIQTIVREDGGGLVEEFRPSPVDIDAVESDEPPRDAQIELPTKMLPTLEVSKVAPGVKRFSDDAIAGQTTDYGKANALMEAIGKRCQYSLRASAVPSDADAADYFLNNSRVGYCDLFATAMVMCARAEGIPARYALGYLPDVNNKTELGSTVIVDHDYHAWAELYFKHVGWVVFDATGSATVRDDAASTGPGPVSKILALVMDTLIAVVAVVLAVIWVLPRFRKKQARRSARSEIEREYVVFAKALLRATKRRRGLSETPNEYLRAVKPQLNGASQAAADLTDRFVEALYAAPPAAENAVPGLKTDVRAFKKLLKSGKGRTQ